MAKITHTKNIVEEPKFSLPWENVPKKEYNLLLTARELLTLQLILSRVGGDPVNSLRGDASGIFDTIFSKAAEINKIAEAIMLNTTVIDGSVTFFPFKIYKKQ